MRIQAPDGSLVDFPDSMSQADIEGVMQKQFPSQPQVSTGMDMAKSGASGLGIGGGMMADALNPVTMGRDLLTDAKAFVTPATQPVVNSQMLPPQNQAADFMNSLYTPQTKPGQYAQRAGIGAATSLLGGPEAAVMGASGGILGQAGGDITASLAGEKYRPYGDVAGGLLGNYAGGAVYDASKFLGKVATGKTLPGFANQVTTDQIKDASRAAFTAAKDNGAVADASKFQQAIQDATQAVQEAGLDPTLHPATTAALNRLQTEAESGQPLDVQKIHTLRQVVQDAAMSNEARDANKARTLLGKFDEYWQNPENYLTSLTHSGSGEAASGNLKQGIDLWKQAKKSEVMDDISSRIDLKAAGTTQETAVKNEFRALAKNKAKMAPFSPEEQSAIRDAARTGATESVLRFMGQFGRSPLISTIGTSMGMSGGGGLGFLLGGGPGAAMGGAAGAVIPPAVGVLSNALYSGMAGGKANYATGLIRNNAANLMAKGLLR